MSTWLLNRFASSKDVLARGTGSEDASVCAFLHGLKGLDLVMICFTY